MEVHHHPHIENQPGGRAGKNFKEYFFEFFMLFLAVFCGFLAENFREHQMEKARAKQYIFSFYKDLNSDTATYTQLISFYTSATSALRAKDSCYDAFKKNLNCNVCLGNLFGYSLGFMDLITADETISQLKNAGEMRSLEKDDADSILKYDKAIRIYKIEEATGTQSTQNEIRKMIFSLMNYDAIRKYNQENRIDGTVPVLYVANKELVNNYFNLLDYYYSTDRGQLAYIIQLKQNADWLIEYFRKKYNFK